LPGSASDANPAIPVTSKHARWVLCPDDGKFYIFGGDYASLWQGVANQSGVNATLAYDPVNRIWEMAYPFWGIAREHYPIGMDEVAVCWDSKRKLFWLTSGYQGNSAPPEKYTGNPTRGILQAFNPATRRWLLPFGERKRQFHAELGGGQHMRSVYDASRDLVIAAFYSGSYGAGIAEFNPATGAYAHKRVKGIGNWFPTNGETNHLIEGKLYCVGGRSGGSRDIAEFDPLTYQARVIATLPSGTYGDQDFSHLPEIDAFLIWTEEPKPYLVDRKTGAISDGPPSPLLKDGTGYRPQHNNRHPSGVIVVGWSASNAVLGKQIPEYWHYKLLTSAAPTNTSTGPQSSWRMR
jgi:hypothetical protein